MDYCTAVRMDEQKYTCEQKNESQKCNVKGKKPVTEGSIHNDCIVTNLKSRENETMCTSVINVKKN